MSMSRLNPIEQALLEETQKSRKANSLYITRNPQSSYFQAIPPHLVPPFPREEPEVVEQFVDKTFPVLRPDSPYTGDVTEEIPASTKHHAYSFLEKAVSEMKDRAVQRDNAGTEGSPGERSMAATVKAFNALTGHSLIEENGWEFMILLKLVRGRQGQFRADDYTDAAAYSGLLGECASTNRKV